MHAPHPPGRGFGGSDQVAADADRKLQRRAVGHVRNRRQVRHMNFFHLTASFYIADAFGFVMQI